jgi:hypothetical protein
MPAKKRSNVNLAAAEKAFEDPGADDAFVMTGSPSPPLPSSAKTSKRQDAKAADKRRMTVYLPEKLAVALELRAVKTRASVSGLVEQAVRTLVDSPTS